jgi:hypothetical protein
MRQRLQPAGAQGKSTESGTFKVARVVSYPLIIGPKNAEAVTGFPWRWCRDTARRLCVPFIGHGRKQGVRADLFLAALESDEVKASDEERNIRSLSSEDLSTRVRSLLGKVRRPEG